MFLPQNCVLLCTKSPYAISPAALSLSLSLTDAHTYSNIRVNVVSATLTILSVTVRLTTCKL